MATESSKKKTYFWSAALAIEICFMVGFGFIGYANYPYSIDDYSCPEGTACTYEPPHAATYVVYGIYYTVQQFLNLVNV